MLQPKYAIGSSFWYWDAGKGFSLNRLAVNDSESVIKKITEKINGGDHGLYDEKKSWGIQYGRITRFKQIYKIIKNKL